ncbi:MAG: cytochrome bc complex cytochrome b subunit [Anaerolineae bacterium]|nr:cytochrome bc complex cytochrome b subunit [Anaerolineae bacterium]
MSASRDDLHGATAADSNPRVLRLIDGFVARITTGLTLRDLRGLARGDAPSRPNPRLRVHDESFLFHIKPAYYHDAVTKFRYTFRLGLLSTYLFFIEIVTGVLLMIYYAPTPERAYGDMQHIVSAVPFGSLVRDIHRLAAEAMLIVVVLHMARTFLTGSYKRPRQFTWLTGVALLLATLFMSFSGYLLPWDQLSLWAVTIGASIVDQIPPAAVGSLARQTLLGGLEIGAAGLLRFYLLHVLFVPLALTFIFFVHYYKVVRVGISLPASEEQIGQDTAKRVPAARRRAYLPNVLASELATLAVITAALLAVIALGLYAGAPLEHHANPLKTPLHTEAPWYFLWIQGLLKLGNATLLGVILPALLLLLLLLLPYVDPNPSRRARDRRVAIYLFLVSCGALVVLSWMGTAQYAVALPPAEEAVQAILPEEGAGPLRALPWDAVKIGDWDTRTYAASTANPEMRAVLARYAGAIEQANRRALEQGEEGLPGGYGKLVVERWQPRLKKVTLRVFWQPAGRAEQVFEQSFFLHQGSNYGG